MLSPEIQQAIQLIRTNCYAEARKLLEPLIAKEPHNITAWFWYVEACPEQTSRLRVLETCLKLNPHDTQVQDAYLKLKEKLSTDKPHHAANLPHQPVQSSTLRPSPARIPTSSLSQRNTSSSNPMGKRFMYGILFVASITVLLTVGYLGWDFLTRGDQGPVLLRLNLEPGRTYTERIVTDTNLGVGPLPDGSQKLGYHFSYTMQGVTAEGSLQLVVAFDWVMAALKQPGRSLVQYDSSQPGGTIPPELAEYAALPGQTIILNVSPQGQLLDLRGSEKILSTALRNIQAGATENDFYQQVANQAIIDTFAGAFPLYASHPVAIAETWQANYYLRTPVPLDVNCRYTLQKRHRGVATIASDCTLNLREKYQYVDIAGGAYDIDGTLKGIVEVDEQSGWLNSGKLESKITITPLETYRTQDSAPPTQTFIRKIIIDQAGMK